MVSSSRICILLFHICVANASTLRLYYPDPNFGQQIGMYYENKNITTTCSNINDYVRELNGYSWWDLRDRRMAEGYYDLIWTDACVMLYDFSNCEGFSVRLDPVHDDSNGNLTKWLVYPERFQSVALCDKMTGGPDYNLDLFFDNDFSALPLLSYRNVCECTNVPTFMIGIPGYPFHNFHPGMDTYGSRFYLYADYDCTGKTTETKRGRSESPLFNQQLLSFKPEFAGPSCRRVNLSATVTKIVLHPNVVQENLGIQVLSTVDFIFNNGSGEIRREYKIGTSVTESSTLLNTKSLSKFSSLKHEAGVKASVTAELQVNSIVASYKLAATVAKSWKDTWETSATNADTSSNERTHSSQKAYQVSHSFHVPPCTVYRIESFVTVLNSLKTTYTTHLKVTGTLNDRTMSKDEIIQELKAEPENGYNITGWEHNIVFVTITGELISTIGLDTVVNATSVPVDDCISPVNFINATIPEIGPSAGNWLLTIFCLTNYASCLDMPSTLCLCMVCVFQASFLSIVV